MDDLERIKRELERQKRDRAQALAQRAKLERRTDPPGTLLGFDRATGQPLVAQGAGIIPMRSLSNIGAIGDVGRAAAGGFDVGNRRSQQQNVRKPIPVVGGCELPGILFFRKTVFNKATVTSVFGYFEPGDARRYYNQTTIVYPAGLNELIWCPNRGSNQTLLEENIPEQTQTYYSGSSDGSIYYFPFSRYEPWEVVRALFWAESKQSGEVAVTFQRGGAPGSAVRDVIYQLSEFGASELSSHDYVMPSFGTPVRTYRGNNTIGLSSYIEPFILRSSPPITLSTDTSIPGYAQSVEDGNTRYPVTFLDLQTNTVVNTSVDFMIIDSSYVASQNLPILFENHLMRIDLKFSDDYYSFFFGFTMDGKIAALAYLDVYTKTGNEYRGEDPDVLFQLPTDLKISGLGNFFPPPSFPFLFVSSDNYFYMPSGVQIDRVRSNVGYSNNVIILGSYFYPKNDCKLTYSTLLKQDISKPPPPRSGGPI